MNECKICGYNETECEIINELCSVHTCEVCKKEGYATALQGAILCDNHTSIECEDCGGQMTITAQPTCLTYTCQSCGDIYYDTNTDYTNEQLPEGVKQ